MSNMSYCRFRNTLEDLKDCYEHMDDELDNNENDLDEAKARKQLIELCKDIAAEYEDEEEVD